MIKKQLANNLQDNIESPDNDTRIEESLVGFANVLYDFLSMEKENEQKKEK